MAAKKEKNCFVVMPFGHYDEPDLSPYVITLNCQTGPDGVQVSEMPHNSCRK